MLTWHILCSQHTQGCFSINCSTISLATQSWETISNSKGDWSWAVLNFKGILGVRWVVGKIYTFSSLKMVMQSSNLNVDCKMAPSKCAVGDTTKYVSSPGILRDNSLLIRLITSLTVSVLSMVIVSARVSSSISVITVPRARVRGWMSRMVTLWSVMRNESDCNWSHPTLTDPSKLNVIRLKDV